MPPLTLFNIMRLSNVVASDSLLVAPTVNSRSFEDMMAEETTFTPSHQPRHVTFVDTVQGGLSSTPCRSQEEVAVPLKPMVQSHPEETGLHAAAHKFQKMWEWKISKLKGGDTSSAGLIFQSWLKDTCVHVEDKQLTQREAIQFVKDFTAQCA